jgi:SpoVK/Ycf46/Vps4 family AAA+-type ATPase
MRPIRTPGSKSAAESPRLLSLGAPADGRTSSLLERVETDRRREDLILSPPNEELFVGLLNEFRRADTLRRHGLPIRSKLLFCGPPGSGKTITAEVLANELGLPLVVARLDAIVSSFLGETASNLRRIFDSADVQHSVIFLDEFDALARARSDVSEHNELRRVVNSLLMMIDRFNGRGFLIAASNLAESLDPALWRRFDEVVLFDLPKDAQIRSMLRLETKNFRPTFAIEDKAQKLRGLSYADIERVCQSAIKRSILGGLQQLSESDFEDAARDERRRQQVRQRLTKKRHQQ